MALETISSADFDCFRRLLYQHSGISLADNKQPLLIGRLGRRLRELGIDSYAEYYQRVSRPGGEVERQRMIDLLTTNETHFFREPQHFVYLREHILPARQRVREGSRRDGFAVTADSGFRAKGGDVTGEGPTAGCYTSGSPALKVRRAH